MKFLVILTLVFVGVPAEYNFPTIEKLDNACKICFDKPHSILKSMSANSSIIEENEILAYLQCILENLGFWDKKMGFQVDHIGEVLRDHKQRDDILKEIKFCNKSSKSNDPWLWFSRTVKCVSKRSIEIMDVIKQLLRYELNPVEKPKANPKISTQQSLDAQTITNLKRLGSRIQDYLINTDVL